MYNLVLTNVLRCPQDLLHTSSSSMEAGNALRRQILEMRKKTYFLEAEKKQLTETVSKLRLSLKTMRESKDRMTQDRLHALQVCEYLCMLYIYIGDTMYNVIYTLYTCIVYHGLYRFVCRKTQVQN